MKADCVLSKTKRFVRNIRRIIEYLPIIWRDRDFDYQYLLDLMQYKLERMFKFFKSNHAMSEDAKLLADDMLSVIEALDRLAKQDYCCDERAEIDRRFGETIFRNGDGFTWELCKDNPELNQIAHELFLGIRYEALRQEKDDFEFVFNTLRDKLQEWWD